MPDKTQELTHNGRKIVISQSGVDSEAVTDAKEASASVAKVSIDGEPIPVEFDPGTQQFIAVKHSPYLSHSTLIDLAKHVADNVIGKRSL